MMCAAKRNVDNEDDDRILCARNGRVEQQQQRRSIRLIWVGSFTVQDNFALYYSDLII